MTINQIYERIPARIRKYHAFRINGRVEVDKVLFPGTLAKHLGIDEDLIHDDGRRFVIYPAE